MGKKLNLPEKEVCDLYISGLNTVQLGKQYNCSDFAIGVILKKHGVKTRSRFDVRKGCYDIDLPIDIISKEYLDGLTLNELGLKYNCSGQTIKKRLVRNDIDMRPRNESCIIELPIDDIIDQYLKGDSIETLAKFYDVSTPTIQQRLKDNDIKILSSVERCVLNTHINEIDIIIEKYLDGIGINELSNEYMYTVGNIRTKLIESGIKIRDATVKTDLHRENLSKARIKLHKDDPNVAKRSSATKQGQDFDAGEWTGFADKDRRHLLHAQSCIQLNTPFHEGCVRHHLTSGFVINVPINLHNNHFLYHRTPNGIRDGKNMMLQNEYAFSVLMGNI